MASSIQSTDYKVPDKDIMRHLPWEVRWACKEANVSCSKRNSRLLVRAVASLVTCTRSTPGWSCGRWFRLPTAAGMKLDRVLPTIFAPGTKQADSESLHSALNHYFCDIRLGEQGFELRRRRGFWEMRISNSNNSLEHEVPILLPVH